ncbi:MAG: acyl carrier protein [Ruminococcaceae bacterium]|jgi:acyl carrier protein|nr:acyl carrier protein [Oscillospiraceae bacterium]
MVFEIIKKIVAEQFGISENEITLDLRFEEDLDADSLDLVDIAMSLEDEFKLEITGDEFDDLDHPLTVGDIVNFVEEN